MMRHRRWRGRGRWAEALLHENLGGSAPPRFGPENVGNAAENWFSKIFQLEIFSQIVSQWSRLAKYYFSGLFEQFHPDFEKPINCCLFPLLSLVFTSDASISASTSASIILRRFSHNASERKHKCKNKKKEKN